MEPTYNPQTLEALDEVRRMKDDPLFGKTYTDVHRMIQDLLLSEESDDP